MPMRSISVLFTLVLAGCAASTTSQPAQSAGEDEELSALMRENAEKDAQDSDQCLDESNEPRQCERDADCCQGFTCGWDPQVSRVMKVCVNAGAEGTAVAAGAE